MWPRRHYCGIDGGEGRFPAVSEEDWKWTLNAQGWQAMALATAAGQEVPREKDQAHGSKEAGGMKQGNTALSHCPQPAVQVHAGCGDATELQVGGRYC